MKRQSISTFRGMLLGSFDGPTTQHALVMRCKRYYPKPHDVRVIKNATMRVKEHLKELAAGGIVRKLHGGERMKPSDVWVLGGKERL